MKKSIFLPFVIIASLLCSCSSDSLSEPGKGHALDAHAIESKGSEVTTYKAFVTSINAKAKYFSGESVDITSSTIKVVNNKDEESSQEIDGTKSISKSVKRDYSSSFLKFDKTKKAKYEEIATYSYSNNNTIGTASDSQPNVGVSASESDYYSKTYNVFGETFDIVDPISETCVKDDAKDYDESAKQTYILATYQISAYLLAFSLLGELASEEQCKKAVYTFLAIDDSAPAKIYSNNDIFTMESIQTTTSSNVECIVNKTIQFKVSITDFFFVKKDEITENNKEKMTKTKSTTLISSEGKNTCDGFLLPNYSNYKIISQ